MLEKRHTDVRFAAGIRITSRLCEKRLWTGTVRVRLLFVTRVVRLKNIVRRTFLAFSPDFAQPDDAFAKTYLPTAELKLYLGMDARDRCHAVEVARAVLNEHPSASARLVRAALLHDVGKSGERFSALERVAVHLYAPALPPEPRLGGLRGAWQRRRHHASYGAQLIRQSGGDAEVARIVERHHTPSDHPEARLLKRVEERF